MQQMPRSNSLAEGKKGSKQGGRRIGKRERERVKMAISEKQKATQRKEM